MREGGCSVKQFLRHLIFPVLLVVLVPIFATCVLCYTFQDGIIHSAPFGIIDEDNSALSRTLVQNLANNDTFDVVFYGDTAEELEAQIAQNHIVAGMVIPKDFSRTLPPAIRRLSCWSMTAARCRWWASAR